MVLVARCLTVAVVAGVAYAVMPVRDLGNAAVLLRLVLSLLALSAVIGWQLRAIVKADHPLLRAVESLATAVTLLIVLFAYVYLLLSASDPLSFSEPLDHPAGIYFTTTVLATVGFGDIAPVSTMARLVASVQMLLDLVLVGLVVRVLFTAAQRGVERQAGRDDPG